jgi:ABC-type nitrate/sulfonate/bicarbonate transport system permease component
MDRFRQAEPRLGLNPTLIASNATSGYIPPCALTRIQHSTTFALGHGFESAGYIRQPDASIKRTVSTFVLALIVGLVLGMIGSRS